MKYEDRKIVGILASNVEPAIALNVIGHLAIAIGKYSDAKIMGREQLLDKSEITHTGISQFPVIITKVKASKLKPPSQRLKLAQNCSWQIILEKCLIRVPTTI